MGATLRYIFVRARGRSKYARAVSPRLSRKHRTTNLCLTSFEKQGITLGAIKSKRASSIQSGITAIKEKLCNVAFARHKALINEQRAHVDRSFVYVSARNARHSIRRTSILEPFTLFAWIRRDSLHVILRLRIEPCRIKRKGRYPDLVK